MSAPAQRWFRPPRTGGREASVRIRRGRARRRDSPSPPRGRLTSSSARCPRGHAPSAAVFLCHRSRGNGPGRPGLPSYGAMRQSYAWPPRSWGSWNLALAGRRLCEELSCHSHEDLGHGGWRAPPVLMKAVEDREGHQDPDHVFGLLDRTSRPKQVVCGESFGKSPVAIGLLAFPSVVGFEPPVQARHCRPAWPHVPHPAPPPLPPIHAPLLHAHPPP